jgi:hypothetical protein
MLGVFALTLFTSATLLFMVQPLIGKMILPLLGGTPEVWNTCMVFFQAVLLAGYAYAHVATKYFGVRRQAAVHLGVLVLPMVFFPLAVNKGLIAGGGGNPVGAVLLVLALTVGVPFFVVSTSAPLLQKWFSSTDHPSAKDPYFLYGASNAGSMLTLVGYPLVVEPNMRLAVQSWTWCAGFVLLLLLIASCAWLLWKSAPAREDVAESAPLGAGAGELALAGAPAAAVGSSTSIKGASKVSKSRKGRKGGVEAPPPPRLKAPAPPSPEEAAAEAARTADVTWGRRLKWVVLGAVPTSLLLGVTTYMTTDIAAIPLLWIPPLALYLLTFIIVFGKVPNWLHKGMILVMPLLTLLLLFMMLSEIGKIGVQWRILLHLTNFFFITMVCHGELARDRPSTKYLTEYFMLMSLGGVVGGMFNALFAPLAFPALAEYPLAMVAACLLLPPLVAETETRLALAVDLLLTALFLLTGGLLLWMRVWEMDLPFARLKDARWGWLLAGTVAAVLGGAWLVWRRARRRPEALRHRLAAAGLLAATTAAALGMIYCVACAVWRARWWYTYDPNVPYDWGHLYAELFRGVWGWSAMACAAAFVAGVVLVVLALRRGDALPTDMAGGALDLLLPLSLAVLTLGLIWGLEADVVFKRIGQLAEKIHFGKAQILLILQYGLPCVLAYTFVERSLRFGLGVAAILLASALVTLMHEHVLFQERSFFGVLRVERTLDRNLYEYFRIPVQYHRLLHGTTLHGQQSLLPPEVYDGYEGPLPTRLTPLTYYHRSGPLGQIFANYSSPSPALGLAGGATAAAYGGFRRPDGDLTPPGVYAPTVGVIGLGTGTTAVYARAGQKFVFYDIDALVKKISWDSDRYFTYVQDAFQRGALLELRLNDARLEIERELEPGNPKYKPDEKFGILVIDAFSSDAIPIHLITRQALRLYRQKMEPDGLICFHVSNRYLNLKPVLANLAEAEDMACYFESDDEVGHPGKAASTWVVLTEKPPAEARRSGAPEWQYMSRLVLQPRWEKDAPEARLALAAAAVGALPGAHGDLVLADAHLWALYAALGKGGSRGEDFLKAPWQKTETNPEVGIWTDDYSNLLSVFNDLDLPAVKQTATTVMVFAGLIVFGLLTWYWTAEKQPAR